MENNSMLLSFSLLTLICFLLAMVSHDHGIVLVKASHHVFRELQSVSTNKVQQLHRTKYHFQPAQHWINDPNGPMYYNGLYHLFYQYNPKGAVWGNIVWAHSVSTDLINWIKLPNAIYPSKPFDIQGCWSGSATILPGNHPVILYTGINNEGQQVQNYAIPANESDPYLTEWHKPDSNPVIYPEIGVNGTAFRDPTTAWFEGGHWKTLVSSRRRHRGIIYLYRSRDFVHWTKAKHPFYNVPMSDMLECPDFFPVAKLSTQGVKTSSTGEGVKHILKISLDNAKFDYYFIGTYFTNKDKFVLDNPELREWTAPRFDYGKYYASKTFFDSNKNRRILWGWANETDPEEVDVRKGWSGIQAIPRRVWLDINGKQLRQWPIVELNQLRTREVQIRDVVMKQGENIEIKEVTATQADVDVVFSFSNLDMAEQFDNTWDTAQSICSQKGATSSGGVGPFGLITLASQNLEEYTPIFFMVFKTNNSLHRIVMCSDARSSTLGEEYYKPVYGGFVDVDLSDRKLSLRTLIDHSVVESFGAGGRTCILTRVYPTLAVFNNTRLLAFNNGAQPIAIVKLNAWSMRDAKINI